MRLPEAYTKASGGSLATPSLLCNLNRKGLKGARMYGIIGRIKAVPGKRDELARVRHEGSRQMPGCHSYVVALDTSDGNCIWVTEVWDDADSHQASLSLPSVQKAIEKGRPLIAAFGERFITTPIGQYSRSGSLSIRTAVLPAS